MSSPQSATSRQVESDGISPEWQLSPDEGEAVREGRWRGLPVPASASLNSPSEYQAIQLTVDAVNVALMLGQPLLVTGEPGCGKTSLAGWVAYRLGLDPVLRFQTRSTAVARDLFYHFDSVGRFHAARSSPNADPRNHISYTALGEAVLRALGRRLIGRYVSADRLQSYPETPVRSVILIDEIDKAPRDFPNDLLGELDSFGFEIPELGGIRAEAPAVFLPIVIITSNIERALPDAFLRRCVYHHMPFPDRAMLERIVYARITTMPPAAKLVTAAIKVVAMLRSPVPLRKPPGTAELLAFVLALRGRGLSPNDGLAGHDDWVPVALTTLVKIQDDLDAARAILQRFKADAS
jgi:MoxR-like ATPase